MKLTTKSKLYILAFFTVIDVVLIGFYFVARLHNDLGAVQIWQPLTIIVAMIIAAMSFWFPGHIKWFSFTILLGMLICTVADFLNIDMTDQFVMIRGLAIFLFGYGTYAVSSIVLAKKNKGKIAFSIIIFSIFLAFLLFAIIKRGAAGGILPYLTVYGVVIFTMGASGFANLSSKGLWIVGRLLLVFALNSLMISDVEFALSDYVLLEKSILSIFMPIAYAGGQLLLALSLSFMKKPEA